LDKNVLKEMKKLENWFNPQAIRAIEDYNHGREITLDQVNSALFSTDFVKETTIYVEAVNSERKEDQTSGH
jgi:hypothetical protein